MRVTSPVLPRPMTPINSRLNTVGRRTSVATRCHRPQNPCKCSHPQPPTAEHPPTVVGKPAITAINGYSASASRHIPAGSRPFDNADWPRSCSESILAAPTRALIALSTIERAWLFHIDLRLHRSTLKTGQAVGNRPPRPRPPGPDVDGVVSLWVISGGSDSAPGVLSLLSICMLTYTGICMYVRIGDIPSGEERAPIQPGNMLLSLSHLPPNSHS